MSSALDNAALRAVLRLHVATPFRLILTLVYAPT